MKRNESIDQFLKRLYESTQNGTFVKATFGNYQGTDPHLQKLLVRVISTRKGDRLSVIERARNRDTARTETFDDGLKIFASLLGKEFFSGHLFTTEADYQLAIGKRDKARLNKAKPTIRVAPAKSHDKAKKTSVDQDAFFLKALGITNDASEILKKRRDKWKQINKFVEILGPLVNSAEFVSDETISVVDMGCGKGYLTFAAYEYLSRTQSSPIRMTGIDVNQSLTDLCGQIADSCGFDGLNFSSGTIAESELEDVNIVIALHACDTATDDAIAKGINANSRIIVTSPCCHREVRGKINPPIPLDETLKHGALLEVHAEFLTDAIRALVLQSNGYETKVIDFIPTSHTPKNKIIAAVRAKKTVNKEKYISRIEEIKAQYGIRELKIESLISTMI